MIIIGERINSSRKSINEALEKKDRQFFQDEARQQEEAGASYIDVNCGSRLDSELNDFLWLLEVIQEAVSIPLCLDSPDPKVLAAGLKQVEKKPLINSITLEPERYDNVAPLLQGGAADIIGLCMDDTGIPNTWDKVLENATGLVEKLGDLGLDRSGIFLDVMVQPLSVDTNNGIQGLNSIEAIMERFPGVHTTCGLSNISYGLPERFLVNRTFMVAAMARGLDSAIIDPMDKKIMTLIRTAEMVLGRDEFCGEFIDAMREGRLEI